MNWITAVCDRVSGVIGALIFSQIPLFFQQYAQRLAGHVAEAEIQVAQLAQTAALSGKQLPEYIGKFLAQGDMDFVAQGELMKALLARASTLREASAALTTASPWTRPYEFLKYADVDIAEATLHGFIPGLTLTLETSMYILLGTFIGYFLFQVFLSIFLWPKKFFQKARRFRLRS